MNPYTNTYSPSAFDQWVTFFGGAGLSLLIFICAALLIFLIVREILCWYWKINERLDVMNNIQAEIMKTNNLLRLLLGQISPAASDRPPSTEAVASSAISGTSAHIGPVASQRTIKTEPSHSVAQNEPHPPEYFLSLWRWTKSQINDFLKLFAINKQLILTVVLSLVIVSCLIILAIFAWAFLPTWHLAI